MELGAHLQYWYRIPLAVKQFLLRAITILILWKVLYLLVLLPPRLVDAPLTQSAGRASAGLLNFVTSSSAFSSKNDLAPVNTENGTVISPVQNIYANRDVVVAIEDGCNGLELFVLYAGFIICLPALLRDKIKFIVGGIALIYAVNVIRCAVITYLVYHNISHADFIHHYVFTVVVYGFIMWLWYLFSGRVIVKTEKSNA